MDIKSIIDKIVFLPVVFPDSNQSVHALLKQSGYFDFWNEISEGEIAEALAEHPELIKTWLTFSEDKRTNSGWYVKANGNGKYIVGELGGSVQILLEFSDVQKACAAFIKRDIEDIRRH